MVKRVENVRDPEELKAAIKSVIATKQYGYENILSGLVVNACLTTLSPTAKVCLEKPLKNHLRK